MPLYSVSIQAGGKTTPTLDCALQPSTIEKKDRKIGLIIAIIAIIFIFKALISSKVKSGNETEKDR